MSTVDERNRLIASHKDASGAFDRALMTLSAGSLGLSIAFVNDIAEEPTSVWVLQTSWICMGLALLFIVASFAVSVEVHRRLIDGLDKNRPCEEEPRWARQGVTWLNGVSAGAFLIGAGFLVYFAFVNV